MVWETFSHYASNCVSLILEGRKDVVRKVTHETHEARWLRIGDESCRGRMVPMSTDLIDKVRNIYKKCLNCESDRPLMLALEMGLMDMVWGLIECAKQTDTNPHTGGKGDRCVQEFFWLYNEQKQTAFDIAIEKGHVELARLLLYNAHGWCLRSQWIRRREALLHLINHDPKFDGFIFGMLEENPKSTALQINGQGGTV
ncbi:hypothetical protein L1987_58223 [Smallanthus sonchifolius]|uniref:Uncharacterized protein n=1 Tax=Smallanthus sonchifolius TaxID=185202 RepID=A0ACB9DFS6_9ASTR|nr:hypothetical protein L1987_58223 [Smallanthus sonchifolius]